MASMKEMAAYAGNLLSDEQAMQLGRATMAMLLLGDGAVAMVGLFDHKRVVGLYGPGGRDADLDLRITVNGNTLPVGRDIERACDAAKAK